MSKKSKAAKAGAAAGATKAAKKAAEAKPLVERIASDDDLRDNVRVAFDAAKDAYERLAAGNAPKVLLEDKKFHRNLEQAATALRQAGESVAAKPKKKKRGGLGKLLIVGVVGAVAAIALSEDLRNKVLDALFGAEEEFDYTSTTAPSAPAPTPSAS